MWDKAVLYLEVSHPLIYSHGPFPESTPTKYVEVYIWVNNEVGASTSYPVAATGTTLHLPADYTGRPG